MAMLRSAVKVALRRTQPAYRLFSSVARRGPACSGAASALWRSSPVSSFHGCSDATRRMVSSYGWGGNKSGMSSNASWSQDSTSWKRPDILFLGITLVVASVFHSNIRASQERKWQRQIMDNEMRTRMMDKEKEDELNI